MRADELAVSGAKRAFISGALEDTYPGVNAGCVKRAGFADFTAAFSRVIEQALNPQEIETALKFYQSDAGTKYVEGTMRRLRARFGEDSGIPKIPGVEDISPAQTAAISDFASSDLGRKILGKQMTESPAALKFGHDMLEELARRCRK
jgi:Uncharacterized protein conserved in bacteria (DUF2059)